MSDVVHWAVRIQYFHRKVSTVLSQPSMQPHVSDFPGGVGIGKCQFHLRCNRMLALMGSHVFVSDFETESVIIYHMLIHTMVAVHFWGNAGRLSINVVRSSKKLQEICHSLTTDDTSA